MEIVNDSLVLMTKEEYTQFSTEVYDRYNTLVEEKVDKSFRTGYYTGIQLGMLIVVLVWILARRIKVYKNDKQVL